jgi:hypothetical protein
VRFGNRRPVLDEKFVLSRPSAQCPLLSLLTWYLCRGYLGDAGIEAVGRCPHLLRGKFRVELSLFNSSVGTWA